MPTTLVIDDMIDAVRLFEAILKQFGFQVIFARNGKEAVDTLEITNPPPDLIICDLKMPCMDGLEFLRYVKMRPQWEHIPFILTTVLYMPSVCQSAAELGADGVLAKPFHPQEMKQMLRKIGVFPVGLTI